MSERVLARGLGASAGRATGVIVFRSDEAVVLAAKGQSVLLVKSESSAEDLEALKTAAGVLCVRGGLTADAAIIARSLGIPCVVGCSSVSLNPRAESVVFVLSESLPNERVTLHRGDSLTIDGATGMVYGGAPSAHHEIAAER